MTEPLTKALIKSWSSEQMRKELKDPVRANEIFTFLNSPSALGIIDDLTTEVVDQPTEEVPAETVVIQEAVDQAAVAEAAHQAELEKVRLAEEAKAAEKAAEPPKKIVVEYQATDENGQPIGRPTHLEAYSWEEMSRKQQEAHVQATRAFHRLKAQKTTFNRQEVAVPASMTDAELIQAAEDLKSEDREKSDAADRKLRADAILKQQQQLALDRENARQKEVAFEFMTSIIVAKLTQRFCQVTSRTMTLSGPWTILN